MKVKQDYSNKPYNRCLFCHHLGVSCDGARTSAMELSRWCEFMRDVKEVKGLTNQEIAEKADVSVKRIEQLMALKCDQDIMRDTARRIENAIIGSSNQYPCYLAFEETLPNNDQKLSEALKELERVIDDNKDYRSALDNIHSSYKAEMQAIREEDQKEIDYLHGEVQKLRAEAQHIRNEAQKKVDYLLDEVKRLRTDSEYWRLENDRKGKLIDKYLDKIVAPQTN